jgi:hypothetical protein
MNVIYIDRLGCKWLRMFKRKQRKEDEQCFITGDSYSGVRGIKFHYKNDKFLERAKTICYPP